MDLFSQPPLPAEKLADAGMNLAADHADRLTSGDWTEQALMFMLRHAQGVPNFQCSEVRSAAEGKVPDHPNLDPRAWGAIVKLAFTKGWIRPLGYRPTNNRISHGRQEQTWTLAK